MRFEIMAHRHGEGVTPLLIDANGFDEARAQARAQGFAIVSIRQRWHWVPQRQRKDMSFDLVLFSQELRSLIDAGLSLSEALTALSRMDTTPYKRSVLNVLIRQLREGKSFSITLRAFPAIFPPLYIALTSASEQTGDLAGALERFISYRAPLDLARKKMTSAIIYPSLLVGVGGLVIVFLMSYVVPRFSRIYEDFGRDLPFLSRLLLEWGKFINTYGMQLVFAVIAIVALAATLLKRTGGRQDLLDRLLALRVFASVRDRVRLYALSRFYRTLGLLQQEGIPIVTAIGLSRSLLGQDRLLLVDQVVLDIRAGVSLSDAMESQGLAPPVASDLLRVGEKTGDVGEKLIRIANFYDEEIAHWTERFVRLFEPLLMLTIGMFIAFVVVLLYLPIFELAGSI